MIELPPTMVPGGPLRWLRDPSGELTTVTAVLNALNRDDLTGGAAQ
ncbi:hypothetical protein [Actinokineospora sp.]